MLSDVSSLTDISSEDDAFVPVAKAKRGAKKQWQPKQVLKAPRITQFSARTLYEEIMNGKVDLDPEYQRDVVWSDAKQTGLIDSLLRNFFIPPIIFAFSQTDDGDEKRTCIDGKQRLTSIQRFMDGQIPFKDSRTNLKMWYKLQPGNEKGKLLPEQYRRQFAAKQISCVEYSDITDDSEREIFQRVQLGVALTPAERMQAIPGPWPQLIRDILNDMDDYRISESLEWSKTRGRDFQSAASIVYMMEKPNNNYPTVTSLEKWLLRVTPPTKAFKDRIMDSFMIFRQLVLTKKLNSVFQKPTRISPIEFVMIVILIDLRHQDHTLTQLSDAIGLMRKDVRKTHDDIRANAKVTKTMSGFINDRWPTDLKKSDPNEKRALAACRATPVPMPRENGKRKRGDSSESDDSGSSEDDRPLKAKPKTAAKAAVSTSASTPQLDTARVSGPASRVVTSLSAPVRTDSTSKSGAEPSTSGTTSRLAKLHLAKANVGRGGQSRTQEPTPPASTTSGRHTPTPQTKTRHDIDPHIQDTVQKIMSQANTLRAQSMWPGQYASQTPSSGMPLQIATGSSSQYTQPMSQSPLNAYPPNPNGPSASGTGVTDPRMNPSRSATLPSSGYSMSASNGTNRPAANSPSLSQKPFDASQSSSQSNAYSRNIDRQSQPNAGGYRDSGSGFRNDSPRQPPYEPRGRGQGGHRANGRGWNGPNDRDRDVLGGHTDDLKGRGRDKDFIRDNGWSNRNGR